VQIKFSFDSSKPVAGEASIEINKSIHDVFSYIGEHFYENYPKWAVEVVELEPLDGKKFLSGPKQSRFVKNTVQKLSRFLKLPIINPL